MIVRARRVAPVMLVALAGLAGVAACMDERARLTPPTLELTVEDTTVAPGGQLAVDLAAADRNGIIYLSARLRCAETDSVLDVVSDGSIPRRESVSRTWVLLVPQTVPANTRLVVEAATIDDQDFTITRRDTVYARVPDVPSDQPPSAPRCNSFSR